MQPGDVLELKTAGFDVYAYATYDVDEDVYANPFLLGHKKLIVIQKRIGNGCGNNDSYACRVQSPAGKKIHAAASLWSCLYDGKEVWVSNLEYICEHAFKDV